MEIDETELTDPEELKFERGYTRKFLTLSGDEGVKIEYENDVAAIDLGLHLTAQDSVTNTRVWFQLKGIHSATLPLEKLHEQGSVSRQIEIKHLRAWYKSGEPVYLVYYVQSADLFLAKDVRDFVDEKWGDELLNADLFEEEDGKIPIHISLDSKVDDAFWKGLYRHRSMRIDGRSFRGRPLGHNHDPLRTTLRVMEPVLFQELIEDLLSEHGYEIQGWMDAKQLFPGIRAVGNEATITYGVLKQKYEIILQITNEFLPDEDGFRIEGKSDYAFGPCAVVIHSRVATPPDPNAVIAIARELQTKRITRLLVFINGYMLTENSEGCCFFEYRQAQIGAGIECMPQHLEDIGFSVCIATNTYYRFRDRLSWWGKTLWSKEKGASIISS